MNVPTPSSVLPSGSPGAPQESPTPLAAGPAVVSHGWLAANSQFALADERKMGRAMSTSVVLHVVGAALILVVMSIRPPVAEPEAITPEKYDLVFLQSTGPGGGGGGGNTQPLPPSKVQLKAVEPTPPVIVPVPVAAPPPPPSMIAPVQTTAVMAMPGTFTGLASAPAAGPGTGGGVGPGTGAGIGPGTGGGFGGGAMRPGSGIVNPTILLEVPPKYTAEAMRAKVQGVVELEAVVGVNGMITEIRVGKSLDRVFGLDEEAIRTAKQWRFRAGTFQGKPVPVLVTIVIEFRIH